MLPAATNPDLTKPIMGSSDLQAKLRYALRSSGSATGGKPLLLFAHKGYGDSGRQDSRWINVDNGIFS